MTAALATHTLRRRLWVAKHVAQSHLRTPGFTFEGRRFRFVFRDYNRTWRNERQVELPIARQAIRGVGPRDILEVGNVLSHYQKVRHIVVDKYERALGVTNQDFLDFAPGRQFARVVAISTFEHIGWDEPDRDAGKFHAAMRHARDLVAPGGRLLVTLPLAYNPEVDAFLARPDAGHQVGFLEAFGPGPGQWRQAASCHPRDHPYDPSGRATGIGIVRWSRPPGE